MPYRNSVKKLLLSLVIALILLFGITANAEPQSIATNTANEIDSLQQGITIQNGQTGDTKDKEEQAEEKENSSIFAKLGEVLSNIGKIFKDGIVWLLEITVGRMFESFYMKLAAGISNWLLVTPKLINFEFIKDSWYVMWILSSVLLAIGAGFSIKKLLTGSNAGSILKVLGLAFFLSYYSLYLIDYSIWGQNQMWSSISKAPLQKIYESNTDIATHIGRKDSGAVTKENIRLTTVDGDTLFKLVFAEDTKSRQKVFSGTPFYSLFLSSEADGASNNNGGGLFVMSWVMICFILLGLFALVRFGTLIFLAVTGPSYISCSAFTGKIEPVVGWANITLRTVLLQSIIDGAWYAMAVSINFVSILGISPVVVNAAILTIAVALSWAFWFAWVKKAVYAPLTLAGGAAIKQFGGFGSAAGELLKSVGERYGNEGLQDVGHLLKRGGAKVSLKGSGIMEHGAQKASRDLTGSERMGNIINNLMRNEEKDRELHIDKDIYTRGETRNLKDSVTWDAIELGQEKLVDVFQHLRKEGYKEDTLKTTQGGILVKSNHTGNVKTSIEKYLKGEMTKDISNHVQGLKQPGSSNGRSLIQNNIRQKYDDYLAGIKLNEAVQREESTRNFVRFRTSTAPVEQKNILNILESKLPKGSYKEESDHSILVPAEYADEVERIIKGYQNNKVKYWTDKDNNYICYDESLNDFVKYKTQPAQGINMGLKS